jgi:hypothetical protein
VRGRHRLMDAAARQVNRLTDEHHWTRRSSHHRLSDRPGTDAPPVVAVVAANDQHLGSVGRADQCFRWVVGDLVGDPNVEVRRDGRVLAADCLQQRTVACRGSSSERFVAITLSTVSGARLT